MFRIHCIIMMLFTILVMGCSINGSENLADPGNQQDQVNEQVEQAKNPVTKPAMEHDTGSSSEPSTDLTGEPADSNTQPEDGKQPDNRGPAVYIHEKIPFNLEDVTEVTLKHHQKGEVRTYSKEDIGFRRILQTFQWLKTNAVSTDPMPAASQITIILTTEGSSYEFPYSLETNTLWVGGKGYHSERSLFSLVNTMENPDTLIDEFFTLEEKAYEEMINGLGQGQEGVPQKKDRLLVGGNDAEQWLDLTSDLTAQDSLMMYDICTESPVEVALYKQGILKIGYDIAFYSKDYSTGSGVQVGDTPDQVMMKLGEPRSKSHTKWTYMIDDYERFYLLFANGEVQFIVLTTPC